MKKIISIILILSLFILGCIPNNTVKLSLTTSTIQITNIPTHTITKIQNASTSQSILISTPLPTKTITLTITLTPTYPYSEYEPKVELNSIGDILPVTKEEVCDDNYPSKVKEISIELKQQVFKLYNISFNDKDNYEVDYIISSDLGGSNDINNLWVQSYFGLWTAYDKDKLEVHLHRLVCKGIIDLDKAQKMMSNHWVSNYIRFFGDK